MNKFKLSLYDTWTMVLRSMKHTTRHVEIIIMTIIMPLLQLLLLSFILGGSLEIKGFTVLDYVLPGILLMTIGNAASMTASSVKEDMSKGIVDRFRTMDIGKTAVLNGHMAATLLRCAITSMVILGMAVLMGFRSSAGIYEYAIISMMVCMFALMYTWAGILWGLICPSVEAVGAFTYLGMFLPYLSSCFVPINTMPSIVQGFAEIQPFTPIVDSLRGLLFGFDTGNSIGIAFAWCIALCIIFFVCSLRIYHKKSSK